jgi:hypothetical protein
VGTPAGLNRFCSSWGYTACLHPGEALFLIHGFSTDRSLSDKSDKVSDKKKKKKRKKKSQTQGQEINNSHSNDR